MASIYKKSYYKVVNGKRVKRFARKYSIKYKDEFGRWQTQPGTTDKELTRRMAASIEHDVDCRRRGKVDPYEAPKREPLSEHVAAYRRFLEAKDRAKDHVDRTIARIDAVFEDAGFTRLDDLQAHDVTDKVGNFLKARRKVLSAKTCNYYLGALGAFCRWAARQRRMSPSPIALMEKLDEVDESRERRVIDAKQFANLIAATEKGETTHRLSGPDRAWLYLVASYSGLRASELASLTPAAFKLDDKPPGILVRASTTKNREQTLQPITEELAKLLRPWLRDREPGERLWPGRWNRKAAEMLRVDLKAAKIEYVTADGVFDFHSLRATYVTNLVRSGVHPRVVQSLARHSTIVLTMGLYTKLETKDAVEALTKLPALPRRRKKAGP